MRSFARNGVHSQGCSFKSLYLNPLNDLRYYEDGGSEELNLHLCSSSSNELSGQRLSSNASKKPMEDGGGCATTSCSSKNASTHRRKGLFPNSCSSLVDVKENRKLRFETSANPNDSKCLWDDSSAVTAPASAWSTLSNRLVCRCSPMANLWRPRSLPQSSSRMETEKGHACGLRLLPCGDIYRIICCRYNPKVKGLNDAQHDKRWKKTSFWQM